MFEKNGHYFADWRNRRGKRQRKSFTSEADAIRYEQEQRAIAHPKIKGKARPSRRSFAPTSPKRSIRRHTPAASPQRSPQRRGVKGPANSRRIKSSKRSRATRA